jgi:hypothetical protein
MSRDTDALIEELARQAGPVRRLAPAWQLVLAYLGLAVLVLAALALWRGVRPDLAARLGEASFALAVGGALLTGATGALAALMLAAPDRSRLWLALPLGSGALWLGAVGAGCLGGWVPLDPAGISREELWRCLTTVALTGTPLTLAMLALLRRACPLRPGLPLLAGALAAAGVTACALTVLHGIAASAMILAWTGGIVALALLAHAAGSRAVAPRAA